MIEFMKPCTLLLPYISEGSKFLIRYEVGTVDIHYPALS